MYVHADLFGKRNPYGIILLVYQANKTQSGFFFFFENPIELAIFDQFANFFCHVEKNCDCPMVTHPGFDCLTSVI